MPYAEPPSPEEFLGAPLAEVAAVMPPTVILAAGGTRRAAALAGHDPAGEDYVRWSRERVMETFELLFRAGAQHVLTCALRASQLAEVGRYGERLIAWTDWLLAGPEALEDYRRRGWRVRLAGADGLEALRPTVERLRAATPPSWRCTLWWHVSPQADSFWRWTLGAARRAEEPSQAAVVRAMYGEDLPLAELMIAFGKPMFVADVVPTVLFGQELQCYWAQRPGLMLDEELLRKILYDYAFLRRTWQADKSGRYTGLEGQRALWESDLTLGLGRRVGYFWYPRQEEMPCE